MHPLPQSVIPAVYSHLNAQVAFFNELPLAVSRSFQQACWLNMQLGQTLIEEALLVGLSMVPTKRATATLPVAASRTQPTADVQVDLGDTVSARLLEMFMAGRTNSYGSI
jgi:hypothetical protein